MPFFQPISILLRVRIQVARHNFTRNPTAFFGTLLIALLLALAAYSMGAGVGAHWFGLPDREAEAGLQRLWLLMQSFWLLALLLPVGIALLGPIPPAMALRPFALRPAQLLTAGVLSCLLDLPTLLALLLTLPLLLSLLLQGAWAQALISGFAFCLLALQTGVLARLLVSLGAALTRRLRHWTETPALAALLLIGLCVGAPPAFASLTTASGQSFQARYATISPTAASRFSVLLPSNLAAHAVISLRRADYPGALGSLGGLAAFLALTTGGALLALRAGIVPRSHGAAGGFPHPQKRPSPAPGQPAPVPWGSWERWSSRRCVCSCAAPRTICRWANRPDLSCWASSRSSRRT